MVSLNSVHELPPDYWRHEDTCITLRDQLHRHVVGLHVRFQIEKKVRHEFFTGFLMYHDEAHLWVSAGHVIQKIRQMLADRRIEKLNAALVDHSSPNTADCIPIDIASLPTFEHDPEGCDFGAIGLRMNVAALLRCNPYTRFLTSDIWKGRDVSAPDGMYVVGHPYVWNRFHEERDGGGSLKTNVACLPAVPIEDRGKDANEGTTSFWGHRDCFYGQLIPFINTNELLVSDIRGMSGGPIFSIHREQGKLVYRLQGMQGSILGRDLIRGAHVREIERMFVAKASH